MTKYRSFSVEFHAHVALQAMVGDQTVAEPYKKHGVHPNMITAWKRQSAEDMLDLLARGPKVETSDKDAEIRRLIAPIGWIPPPSAKQSTIAISIPSLQSS